MIKAKLTPIGRFEEAIVIDDILQISKVGKNSIYISYHCKDFHGDKFLKGKTINLNKWNLILYLAESEVIE